MDFFCVFYVVEHKCKVTNCADFSFFISDRIEEEELDKYNIPTKVESEKYKVIRTFSFLKNRMASTRNKTKVNPYHKLFSPLPSSVTQHIKTKPHLQY